MTAAGRAPAPVVLLLAGTREAREIAAALAADGRVRVIASLAGATRHPAPLGVETRIGGFGGADGLAAELRRLGAAALVDASHPFASGISAAAARAAAETGTPRLVVSRPPWRARPGDDWRDFDSFEAAADAIPRAARVFLAAGARGGAEAFAARRDLWRLTRAIDAPAVRPPLARGAVARGRPPFAVGAELALLRRLRIDLLVARNAGGRDGEAKLRAARTLGLPVFMIRRPALPEGEMRRDTSSALAWILPKIDGNP